MESTMQRSFYARKKQVEECIEVQDCSLTQLREGIDKAMQIEELMRDVQVLRRQNELKSKIILNLQGKQGELLATIQYLRDAIESQNIEFRGYHQKILSAEMENTKKDELQSQMDKLRERYANCEEENIILRHEIKERERDIFLMQEALKIRNSQFKQKQQQLKLLKKEKDALLAQKAYYGQLQAELDLLQVAHLQKDSEVELQLAKYRHVLSNYERQLQDAVRHEEGWQLNYTDLSDTVHHIETLRQAHRIKRVLK